MAFCLAAVLTSGSDGNYANPVKPWLSKPGTWSHNPLEAFYVPEQTNVIPGLVGIFLCGLIFFGIGAKALGREFLSFVRGFIFLFGLAVLGYLLAGQELVKTYHLGYALWALFIGLLISNTINTLESVHPALRTEFYIKTGLVLLGAEVLFSRLLALGLPGICIAWVVTPIVLITTFWFDQRILRIESPTHNMVISADLSVCGVSAANGLADVRKGLPACGGCTQSVGPHENRSAPGKWMASAEPGSGGNRGNLAGPAPLDRRAALGPHADRLSGVAGHRSNGDFLHRTGEDGANRVATHGNSPTPSKSVRVREQTENSVKDSQLW